MRPDNPQPNSREDFLNRFEALATEANAYGIQSVSLLFENDPMTQQSFMDSTRNCSPYTAIGMLDSYRLNLLEDLKND